MNKLIAMIIVIFGIWLVFWPPVEYVTNIVGPVWSMIIGVVIVIGGFIFWKIKAV